MLGWQKWSAAAGFVVNQLTADTLRPNPWRCQEGHQWALVAGSNPVVGNVYYLVISPYVFVGILAPVVPFSVPGTLG